MSGDAGEVRFAATGGVREDTARLERLLAQPGTSVVLPDEQVRVDRGLRPAAGCRLRGEGAGSWLVCEHPLDEPLLHVRAAGVAVESLGLRLPATAPGEHRGDRGTAVTVGAYLTTTTPDWVEGVRLRDVRIRRTGSGDANAVAVMGAVRGLVVERLEVTGGGTGLAVHWGAVGTSVQHLTGPSVHPHDLAVTGLVVRDAGEGFYLSSVHDVVVDGAVLHGVGIGFRVLPGDNLDRYVDGPSRVGRAVRITGCDVRWNGRLYGVRVAGWGRSEVDGRTRTMPYRDLRIERCTITAVHEEPGERTAVLLEQAEGVVLRDLRLGGQAPQGVRVDGGTAVAELRVGS